MSLVVEGIATIAHVRGNLVPQSGSFTGCQNVF